MSRFEFVVSLGFWGLLAAPLAIDVAAFNADLSLRGMRPMTEVEAVAPDDWVDGTATQKAEQLLVGGSVLARWVVPHYNAAMFEWTGRTPPAAHVDDDGWIFMSSRTRSLSPERYDALLRTVPDRVRSEVDSIEARGPRVVVTIVPDRARMHPEHAYPSGELPVGKADYLPRLVQALREEGLTVIEFQPALEELRRAGGEPFYRADHHWTSRGARVSAQALADELRAGGHVPTACQDATFEPLTITWFDEPEVTSLVPKLGLPYQGEHQHAWARTYERAQIAPQSLPRGDAPIVYVTTSYGRWGAPQMLSNALRCPVVVALRNGNSLTNAASLAGRVTRFADLDQASLVIWELLEHDLYSAAGVPLGQDG